MTSKASIICHLYLRVNTKFQSYFHIVVNSNLLARGKPNVKKCNEQEIKHSTFLQNWTTELESHTETSLAVFSDTSSG